jgi:hypothetical protein
MRLSDAAPDPMIFLSRLGRSPEELQTRCTKQLEANENRVAGACQEVRKVPTMTRPSAMRQLQSLLPLLKDWPLRALRDACKRWLGAPLRSASPRGS